MSVYNIYFSPTGGTKKVSDIISGAISDGFCNIDLIKKGTFKNAFEKDDICIVSVPAFGGRIPQNACDKIKSFKGNGVKAVLVAVFGNRAIDDTLIELYDLTVSAGFNIVAGIEAVAEHSLVRMYGNGRPNDNDKYELEEFAKKICEKLEKGDFTAPELPGNRPYKEFKPSAMSLVVDDTCINCKKCARECPVDAIPQDNVRTIEGDKCFSCMHCVSICPVKARHNSIEATKALEERLRERCAEAKSNKLYIRV